MSQPYYVLEFRYPDGVAETHEIKDSRRVLGRSRVKADLHIADKKASGKHAELFFEDGVLSVRDLGSTNGTHFRDERQEEVFELAAGEDFKVGDTHVRVMAIHGLPESHARTVIAAPSWLQENDDGADSTRALDAEALMAMMADEDAPTAAETTAEPTPPEESERTRALPPEEMAWIMAEADAAEPAAPAPVEAPPAEERTQALPAEEIARLVQGDAPAAAPAPVEAPPQSERTQALSVSEIESLVHGGAPQAPAVDLSEENTDEVPVAAAGMAAPAPSPVPAPLPSPGQIKKAAKPGVWARFVAWLKGLFSRKKK